MEHQPFSLYLVRHGQTDLNRDRRFRGMSLAPLNPSGRDEATAAAAILRHSSLEAVHASPLPRSVQTAEIISGITGAQVVPDERFTDIDYGQWQGLDVTEVTERFGPEAIEGWKRDPGSFTFPDGDSMAGVRERIESALYEIGGEYAGRSVAVVTHMAVLKVCFLAALGLPFEWFWRVSIDNGSVSLFTGEADAMVLGWWNRLPVEGVL